MGYGGRILDLNPRRPHGGQGHGTMDDGHGQQGHRTMDDGHGQQGHGTMDDRHGQQRPETIDDGHGQQGHGTVDDGHGQRYPKTMDEEFPECIPCDCHLTIKHVLIECFDTADIRKQYFNFTDLETLFNSVACDIILAYLSEINLIRQI